MSIESIEREITGSRESIKPAKRYEEYLGIAPIGLAKIKPGLAPMEPPTPYSHYAISSGECKTEKEAYIKFWEDYNSKGPYGEGSIFWRRVPEMLEQRVFGQDKEIYCLRCRFSIADISPNN